jgi:hypothetical protein
MITKKKHKIVHQTNQNYMENQNLVRGTYYDYKRMNKIFVFTEKITIIDGTKKLGHGTNQDYIGNKKLFHRTLHDYER